jgi:hypothetical protein
VNLTRGALTGEDTAAVTFTTFPTVDKMHQSVTDKYLQFRSFICPICALTKLKRKLYLYYFIILGDRSCKPEEESESKSELQYDPELESKEVNVWCVDFSALCCVAWVYMIWGMSWMSWYIDHFCGIIG